MEEDNYKCPKCECKSYFVDRNSDYELRTCSQCDYENLISVGKPEKNFFAECSTTESLAWQYIGWSAAILNNQTRLPEQTTIADLKEALEHFKKRWEEILNETK